MAQLAIKGHPTRGNEVIEILEMLGGNNKHHINITECNLLYTIREGDDVIIATYPNSSISQIYTLEEFLEKFPYKVGDKVLYKIYGIYSKIKSMLWNKGKEQVFYRLESNKLFVATADELKTYKEETMEGKVESFEILESHCADEVKIEFDPFKFEIVERDNCYYVVKKKTQYPKTYEECCEVLFPNSIGLGEVLTSGYNCELLKKIGELLICRDAYWKIAGEQMRLGKSLKPDWEDETEIYYTISYDGVNIKCYNNTDVYSKLAFPTEEMRDTFYENFKDLINETKELL